MMIARRPLPLALWSAIGLCLCLSAGIAHADLSPYALSLSETLSHQSNVFPGAALRGSESRSDWISSTELLGQFDQTFGRDRVQLAAAWDLNRYRQNRALDHDGYRASGEVDWSIVGDLSGAFGADSSARLYRYGLEGEQLSSAARNIETTNHVFSRAQLGGNGLWTLLAGFEGVQLNYSDTAFAPNEQRQWSLDGGARYQAGPDLSATTTVRYTRGRYPYFASPLGADDYTLRTVEEAARWQAGSASVLDMTLGRTRERHDILPSRDYWNGQVRWTWAPPTHLRLVLELGRDAGSTDNSPVASLSAPASVTSRSLNNRAHANLGWELSSKISASAALQFVERRYADIAVGSGTTSGSNRTHSLTLALRYQPTQAVGLGCGASREVRTTDAVLASLLPAYATNTVYCSGQLSIR